MRLRLHAVEWASRANGPGRRAAIWFQGCTLACPECFNPQTHAASGGWLADTAPLAGEMLANAGGLEGVTISGGEPFQQPAALFDLLQRLNGSGLSRLVFSGYTLTEIRRMPLGTAILAHADVLISGRYVGARHLGRAMLGSANQRIHLLTNRYTVAELIRVPSCEVILHPDGSYTVTGVAPLR